MMKYKGYFGEITYDDKAQIFHGEVINSKDIITFQGKSVNELRKAFHDSINDYLAMISLTKNFINNSSQIKIALK